jgi:hypothetical protein
MKEAQGGVARFPKLEICDFERVCEFAYRGNYTNPAPVMYDEADVNITTDFYILSDSIEDKEPDTHLESLVPGFFDAVYIEQECESTYIEGTFGHEYRDTESSPRSRWEDGVTPFESNY